MTKLKRVLSAGILLGLAAVMVLALTFIGSTSEGPFGQILEDLGSIVARTETETAWRIQGAGRKTELSWFEEIRSDPERLRHPDMILLGCYDNELPGTFDGVTHLEDALGQALPLIHVFTAWGDAPDQAFPRRTIEAIWEVGSVPIITWEPWLSTFDGERHEGLAPREERDRGGMASVARGEYDFYLTEWFAAAAAFGKPLFVRFGHEMNDPYRYPWGPQNNEPGDYIAAFRHVVAMAIEAGASNVLWVWSPNLSRADLEAYYPGDDVVDWVGATVLNYGDVAQWSQWWTFDDIFTRKYDRLASFRKPIMIAELGTLMAGGLRAPWFEQALTGLPQRLPDLKAVVFFHSHSDATVTQQTLDWSFADDANVGEAVRRSIAPWSAPGTEAVSMH